MFLQDIFPKSLEVSEKSLWSKQSKNCQDVGLEFYGLARKWFMQVGVEFAGLNGLSHIVSKKKKPLKNRVVMDCDERQRPALRNREECRRAK